MNLVANAVLTFAMLLSPEQLADGWIMLFDGQTTYGWQTETPESWTVDDGVLTGKAGAEITTTTRFPEGTLAYETREVGEEAWQTNVVNIPAGARAAITLAAEGDTEFRSIFYRPAGMKLLFNGENLDDWTQYPDMAGKFSVDAESKRLVVKDGPGMLETKESYGDFILQTEVFTAAEGLNSGIFFRCIPGEKMNGYESQIHNGFKNGNRTQPEDAGTGAIFRRTMARYVPADDKTVFYKTIVADGPHFAVWVNGLQVTDWTDDRKPDTNPRRGLRLEPGTIMLQAHDPTTDVYFQDMKIRSLTE